MLIKVSRTRQCENAKWRNTNISEALSGKAISNKADKKACGGKIYKGEESNEKHLAVDSLRS